jgi:hypothetical protein
MLSLRLSHSEKLFQIVDKAPSSFFPEKVFFADIRQPLSISFSIEPIALVNLAAEHCDDVRVTSPLMPCITL